MRVSGKTAGWVEEVIKQHAKERDTGANRAKMGGRRWEYLLQVALGIENPSMDLRVKDRAYRITKDGEQDLGPRIDGYGLSDIYLPDGKVIDVKVATWLRCSEIEKKPRAIIAWIPSPYIEDDGTWQADVYFLEAK